MGGVVWAVGHRADWGVDPLGSLQGISDVLGALEYG